MPAPGMPADEIFGPDGRPASFAQAGWQVDIGRYAATGRTLRMRLTAVRGGARVKLGVSRWELGQ